MFKRLLKSQSGAVGIIVALSLTAIIGGAALSVELGQGYLGRVDNQRVADMAALSGATAYKTAGGGATGETVAKAVAKDIAKANGVTDGVGGAVVTAAIVSVGTPAQSALKVDVSTQLPIMLAKVLNVASTFTVHSSAIASLTVSSGYSGGCVTALSNGTTAISTSGGASISTTGCAINAVGGINNGGASISATGCATTTDPNCSITSGAGSITNNYGTISANFLNYGGSFSNPGWNTAVTGSKSNNAVTIVDPLKGDAALYGADGTGNTSGLFYNASHISTIITTAAAIADTAMPATCSSFADWNLLSNASSSPNPAKVTYNSATKVWTIAAGDYCINNFATEGGLGTITFQNGANVYVKSSFAPSSPVTFGTGTFRFTGTFNTGSYTITFNTSSSSSVQLGRSSDTITIGGGGKLLIGDGPVTIPAALSIGGASLAKFGTGAHIFKNISVSGSGALITGPGAFAVSGTTSISGGGILAPGLNTSGSVLSCPLSTDATYAANSYVFGGSINLAGSSYIITCDGPFSATANFTTAGGSRLIFGNTPNHIINGNFVIGGAVFFGRGLYTINGSFTNSTGGTTWPWTYSSFGYTSGPYGTLTYADSSKNTSSAMSAGTGYDQIGVDVTFVATGVINLAGGARTYLVAPSTTTATGVAGVLFATLSSSATTIGAGATSMFDGMVYAPKSDVTLSGGAGVAGGSGCFMVVANTITASGGASTLSNCKVIGGGSSSSSNAPTKLIQ